MAMHNFGAAKRVSLYRLSKRLSGKISALKRIYDRLCTQGVPNSCAAFFADNFHNVISKAEKRASKELKDKYIPLGTSGTDFPLAEKVINISGDELASADEIILAARTLASEEKIYGEWVEYLAFTVSCILTERIYECAKTWDRGLIRYITLLSSIGGMDVCGINDAVNPVGSMLSQDPAYKKSDARTKLLYREAIYMSSVKFGVDELKLCGELLEKYQDGGIDIKDLTVVRSKTLNSGAAVAAVCALSAGAFAVSLAIGIWADSVWAAILLFLPAMEALRPLSDKILYKGKGFTRLMRLDPECEEVGKTGAAIVMSAAVSDAEDAAELYDKLLRLYCLNPEDNIRVCALLDLPAEQVPITSEDRAVIDSLGEVIEKLEKIKAGKFSCMLRKRSFSETQQEYMGYNRKRGALMELAEYIKNGRNEFYATLGAYENLRGVEYICAVDSDTLPLMDTVTELLAIALHPANKVCVENGVITKGYGIIAPRMVTRLGESLRTEFSKSLGGIGSRSSYDEEAASLYQDVFARGTFCGKGLISVSALLTVSGKLKGERILSHDILEGELLKTAYAGDVTFTEGFPKTPQSYYRRLDRWIRGDFQNIPEIFSKNYDSLSKLKLLDNLRRAITPVSVFLGFYAGFVLMPPSGAIIAVAGLVLWLFPSVWSAGAALIKDRTLGRRFYSGLLSSASQGLRYILYSVIMLPTLAVKSLRAAATAVFRLFSGRHLLEWTTSDVSDRLGTLPLRYYLVPEVLSLSLLWSPDYLIRLFGALFSLMPALLAQNDSHYTSEQPLKYRDSRELSKQVADMWGYFENYASAKDNFLPPDNVQFAPVYRVAHRTSPTNIGLYMLSVLAAFDRRLISKAALIERLERAVEAVERMEKYKGNLYNWYDTRTLKIISPAFVSSVDSGNFTVCMVALKEGIKELGERGKGLYKRICRIVDNTDLSVFYDSVRGLMAIGIEPETGKRTKNHYDYLMSEARLTSFWAIASRQVPKSHWQRLSRAMLSSGFFGGAASYSGTMFEYFMPEIFLKSPEGSLFSESLKYALWVQKKYARSLKRPYGVSESGYFSFDPALNYRYSAHGVPATGVRRGLENNYIVSPYSTYISLGYSPAEAAENLRELAEYGMYGSYGLYEALDFTSSDSGRPEPVRSYMAHHVGMSILSVDNALSGGIMQKRFMQDLRVRGALELLDERFHLGAAVFENVLRRPRISAPEVSRYETETFEVINLSEPRIKLLCNGEYTLMIADNGASYAFYRSKNVYLGTRDLLSRPQGIFNFISDGCKAIGFSCLPDIQSGGCSEFSEDAVAFYRNTDKVTAGMKVRLHSELPCELRSFAIKNEMNEELPMSVISYIEPSLQQTRDERAHPAYSKMFLRLERDPEWDIVIVTRLREDSKIYVGIGFIEDVRKTVSFDRGEVLSSPEGINSLSERFKEIPPSLIAEPDPCVYIKADINLPAKSETEITLFIVCADSKDELINRVSSLRRKRLKYCSLPRLDTAAGRVASYLLPKMLYSVGNDRIKKDAVLKNRLGLSTVYEISASLDLPTVMIVLNGRNDSGKLSAYIGAYKLLRQCGFAMQLVVAFDDRGRYEREHYNELIAAARELGCEGSVYSPGGILPLDLAKVREGMYELICAYACHVCSDDITGPQPKPTESRFISILDSHPVEQKVSIPVACGGFSEDTENGAGYVINQKTPLPWCHILSNPIFGTLLSNNSLGFTYAFNSREYRLTPWDNDPMRDNSGERLLIRVGGKVYDLIRGSAAVFSFGKAEYFSKGDGFEAKVNVGVSEKGAVKRVRVWVKADGSAEIIYYAEPCMGVDRSGTGLIIPERLPNGLLLYAPASELGGYMSVICSKPADTGTDRASFFSGKFSGDVSPSPQLICSVVCRIESTESVDFYMSCALSREAALKLPGLFCEQSDTREIKKNINSKDIKTDILAQWLRYQALHGRVYAKTGFYQCSGAYGFRDQLQDCCGIASVNPGALKTQILRCCRAQFVEGDVMHWFHTLPLKKHRGIRTKISDDALWLVYAVCEYVRVTKDSSLLSLNVSYSDGINLGEGENERYGEVFKTAARESVYMHCRRAVDYRARKTGSHGLMLIGTGDWNDGFNNVGPGGKGESVWLTEFYILILKRFSKIADIMGDTDYSKGLLEYAQGLSESVETNGRDTGWYLRGYFDNGQKLGCSENEACRIDSIAQSFAQFAGLGKDDGFTSGALLYAYEELFDSKRGIVKLFTPAFPDDAEPDPGYVSRYPDGIRENGGQYTHGAVWLEMALRQSGHKEEADNILSALSPIAHSENSGYERYKVEPYYLCGDVYANKNCMGRGGWSIYTGSAAWLYRALEDQSK